MHALAAGIVSNMGIISNSRLDPLHPLNTYSHEVMPITNNKSADITLILLILIYPPGMLVMVNMPYHTGCKGKNQ